MRLVETLGFDVSGRVGSACQVALPAASCKARVTLEGSRPGGIRLPRGSRAYIIHIYIIIINPSSRSEVPF